MESISTARDLIQNVLESRGADAEVTYADAIPVYAAMTSRKSPVDVGKSTNLMGNSSTTRRPTRELVGVIIETRSVYYIFDVVTQVRELGITVQLFHGRTNREFVTQILSDEIASGGVVLSELNCDALGSGDYNGLLLNPSFWNCMIGRNKILIFQTDAAICRNTDYPITLFMDYDYVGSAWSRKRPEGLVVDGGNGGLSLRDWGRSMEALAKFPADGKWRGGEDTYFCFHIELIGGLVASPEITERFGSQYAFTTRSFGAHSIKNMRRHTRTLFFAYCPESKGSTPEHYSKLEYSIAIIIRRLRVSNLMISFFHFLHKLRNLVRQSGAAMLSIVGMRN